MRGEVEGRLATVSALVRAAPDSNRSSDPLAGALRTLFTEVMSVGPHLEALLAGIEGCGADRILAVRTDAPVEPTAWLALVASPAAEVVLPAEPDSEHRLLLLARDAALDKGSEIQAGGDGSVEALLASMQQARVVTFASRVENPSV